MNTISAMEHRWLSRQIFLHSCRKKKESASHGYEQIWVIHLDDFKQILQTDDFLPRFGNNKTNFNL